MPGSVTLESMTRLSWGFLCLVLACDSGGETKDAPKAKAQAKVAKSDVDAKAEPEADQKAEPKTEPAKADGADPLGDLPEPPGTEAPETGPVAEPEAGDEVAPEEPATDPVAEPEPAADPAADLPPRERPEIPVAVVAASSTQVPWREVAKPNEAVAFEALIRGVLGKSTGGYWDVSDQGELVLRPEIQAPQSKIIGYWPGNAWNIETRVKIDPRDRADDGVTQVRLMRLRGNRRWVPQEYNFEQRWEDEGQRIVMAAKGGILVEHMGAIERVSGQAEAPELGQTLGPNIVAFFETRKGRIYTVERKDGELLALRQCEDLECADLSAMKVPSGTRWDFTSPVPRQKNSISVVATLHEDAGDKSHVMHYETGGWKLDQLSRGAEGTVADQGRRAVGHGRSDPAAPRPRRRLAFGDAARRRVFGDRGDAGGLLGAVDRGDGRGARRWSTRPMPMPSSRRPSRRTPAPRDEPCAQHLDRAAARGVRRTRRCGRACLGRRCHRRVDGALG